MAFDPAAVREFEHAGWQQAAADYNATFVHATAGFVEPLLDAAGVVAGSRVLDICCGTGVVAAAAARRGGNVVGVDFSPAMLGEARAAHPALRFDAGDAEALPYPDAGFDAAVSNFGMHHVPRPQRAIAEAHRVLRPRGRFAFTTWAVPDDNIAWRLLFAAVRAHGDPDAAQAPPPGGNLGRAEAVLHLLDEAGFADCRAAATRWGWRLADGAALVAALRRGTVRTAALIAAQPAAALPAIVAEIDRLAAPYRDAAGLAVPIVAILAHGTKPP